MGSKYLHKTLVLQSALFEIFHLVAAGAEGTAWSMFKRLYRGGGLFAGVDQIFMEGADNAILPRIQSANFVSVLPAGFYHSASGGVNNRGDTARLSVKRILLGHRYPYP